MAQTSQSNSRRSWGCLLIGLLIASVFTNLVLCGVVFLPDPDAEEPAAIEVALYGPKRESNKVAVIQADGALVEGLDGHILRQIEAAGSDEKVKAVVLRINSPGGTIGSSEDIHRELVRLKTGRHPRHPGRTGKPIVASMGSIAASGGYYIAMPAQKIYAEKGTLTGSIGVYAALPNAAELANKHGVKLELIKAGDIKGSGSPLHTLTPEERQPWQDMVDQAYDQFLEIVVGGRPALTAERLRNEAVMVKKAPLRDDKGNVILENGKAREVEVSRRRADGGTFTAQEAKNLGLIDDIGLLEDAVAAVAQTAGLSEYRVVTYKRPPTLLGMLLGVKAQPSVPDWEGLAGSLSPRVWYMAPGSEVSGILATAGR